MNLSHFLIWLTAFRYFAAIFRGNAFFVGMENEGLQRIIAVTRDLLIIFNRTKWWFMCRLVFDFPISWFNSNAFITHKVSLWINKNWYRHAVFHWSCISTIWICDICAKKNQLLLLMSRCIILILEQMVSVFNHFDWTLVTTHVVRIMGQDIGHLVNAEKTSKLMQYIMLMN